MAHDRTRDFEAECDEQENNATPGTWEWTARDLIKRRKLDKERIAFLEAELAEARRHLNPPNDDWQATNAAAIGCIADAIGTTMIGALTNKENG